MQEKYEQKIKLFEMRVFIFCFSQGVVSREASYSYVFQEANASWPKLKKPINAGEVRTENYIVQNMRDVFIFCFSQGIVSREASYSYVFQEANASWPKLEKPINAGEVRTENYI